MALSHIVNAVQDVIISFQNNLLLAALLLVILWAVQIINWLLQYRLNKFGIYPRHLRGLPGIFATPFLHNDFNHLFFNSVPFFILANLILLHGEAHFFLVSLIIVIVSGIGVWVFGQSAIHIGASGLIMGYFGYLLAEAYYGLTATTVILAIIALYYFGGLIFALIPGGRREISFSGHFFGCLSGILAAYLFH